MRRSWLLVPFALAAAGCSDTPTAVTNADTVAQQQAAEKKATEEESNMRGGAPDPAKKPGKPRK